MHRLALASWLVLAACAPTVADDAISVCEPLCRCTDVPLPTVQQACATSCEMQFQMHPLADPCVACVIEHADRCTTLVDDCTPVCTQAVPLRAYGGP